eukprot:TRINITY_DN7116_c0_g1_i1.p2 TRINITY_DN7116_c0_g1~~TRINITY_DN7116_c0_g1_i1.p2  ORF type:complete len:170 (+),score=6.95 TRINITY_DN7116_c0_g1_i1:215-724(+)
MVYGQLFSQILVRFLKPKVYFTLNVHACSFSIYWCFDVSILFNLYLTTATGQIKILKKIQINILKKIFIFQLFSISVSLYLILREELRASSRFVICGHLCMFLTTANGMIMQKMVMWFLIGYVKDMYFVGMYRDVQDYRQFFKLTFEEGGAFCCQGMLLFVKKTFRFLV